MSTPDGIDAKDWEAVQDLAVDIVNAPDHEKASVRQLLLDYLDTLEARCGTLPSILATRADYLEDDDPRREQLLLRAYELAESRQDTANRLYIAHSLAELYLERRQLADADQWLSRMRQGLTDLDDPGLSEDYGCLREQYRRLVIMLASRGGESNQNQT
jgi:hypothetical protein